MADDRDFRRFCSEYVKNLDSTAFDRYKNKLQYCNGDKQIPDPYAISEGWEKKLELWPDLTYGDIYVYLIETPGLYTKESLKAYKSLEAYTTFTSGNVKEVIYHFVTDQSPYCVLKAQVTPSQRLRDRAHEAWVCLTKKDGSVYCAHCTCMAGLGEVCSHVAALLFKIQTAGMLGLTKLSTTSVACQWNRTFRENINPKSVGEFSHLLQRRKQAVQTVGFHPNAPLPCQETLKELKVASPKSVFFDIIQKLDPEDTDSASEGEDEFHVMEPLTSLYIENCKLSGSELEQKCTEVFNSISVTPDQVKELELRTREQSVCKLWFEHRRGRITASKFHDVIVRKDSTPPDCLVFAIMGYKQYDLSTKKEVKWGVDHEEAARKAYITRMSAKHAHFSCRLSGFLVDDQKPFLGASADGIATCDCHGTRTVEIKCPYKYKDGSPIEAAQIDTSFCLDKAGNLKTTHKYYSQMQLQMHVNRVSCGDFVIYTLKELHVNEMIPYDKQFTQAGIKKSEHFFLSHVLPEILTGMFESSLHDTSGKDKADELNEDNEQELFCLCNQPEYGKMIACDDEDCDIVWFHYACVNVKRKPRGKWFCPDCKRDS